MRSAKLNFSIVKNSFFFLQVYNKCVSLNDFPTGISLDDFMFIYGIFVTLVVRYADHSANGAVFL